MLDTARQEAMAETVAQASRRHASAIINVRFTTTNLGNNMIECQVSGMAVKAEKIDE
ncbi:YbjQ family protein [Blautia wexlerae]|nr:YbjQ family protein [Blautia wexlerae]